MAIARISLTDFRSHADAVIRPRHPFVLLTGENGAGKTNILEALSLLAPGRGLRAAPLPQMPRQGGSGGFGIAAELQSDVTLATGVSPDAPSRRQVRINGAQASANALSEWLSIIWLTPAMDRIFADTPSARRRFLDRLTLALHPGHAHHAARYEAAMRERTRLLTDEAPADPAWLTALEARMAEHGEAIDQARASTVTALAEMLAVAPEGPFARPLIAIELPEPNDVPLGQALAQSRRRDAAAGRALVGPHRADLAVVHAAKGQAAALCSTGEQKALLLSILLGHADLVARQAGRAPLLLLDESTLR